MTDWLVDTPFVRVVGTALVAFLWQGAVIGAITAGILFGLRRASANARYLVGCLALGAMAAAPAITMSDPISVAWAPPSSTSSSAPVVSRPADHVGTKAERTPGRPAPPIESRLPIVVLIWVMGVTALVARLLGGWIGIRRLRRRAVALEGDRWSRSIARLTSRLGIRRHVRLLESTMAVVPFVVGWLRPVIVLPTSAIAGLSPAQLDAILAHELIHVRRGDYLVNALQCGLEILFFYHPAVWWISRQVRIEREYCCDDVAAEISGDPVTYAAALTSLEHLRRHRRRLAMAANGGDLVVRVRRLVAPDSIATSRMSGGLLMSVLLTVVLLGLGGPLGRVTDAPDKVLALAGPRVDLNLIPPALEPVVLAPAPASPARTRPIHAVAPAAPEQLPAAAVTTTPSSSLEVIVEDEQHGVIPGATVSLTDFLDDRTRQAVTSGAGRAVLTDVARSTYQLSADMPGFKRGWTQISVPPGQSGVVRFFLQIDSFYESLLVRSNQPASPDSTAIFDGWMPATNTMAYARLQKTMNVPQTIPDAELSPQGPAWRPLTEALTSVPGAPGSSRAYVPIRVGGDIARPRKTRDAVPIYPAAALASGEEGSVNLSLTITKEGTATAARVTDSGTPVGRRDPPSAFAQAVLDAVGQWSYTPARLNGAPVESTILMVVRFAAR